MASKLSLYLFASIASRRKWNGRDLNHPLSQPQQCFTQFRRVMDNERKVERHQIARHTLNIIVLLLKQHPCWCWRQRSIRGNLLLHGREVGLKLDLHLNAACLIFFLHKRLVIEILRFLKGLREDLYPLDAIQPKDTVSLAQAAVPAKVPVPFPPGNTIRLDLAVGALFVMRAIVDGDALGSVNSSTQIDQQRGIRPRLLVVWKERQVRR